MTGVIKRQEVRLTEAQSAAGAESPAARPAAGPQARILQHNDREALVEVTCACGKKIQIRCAYGAN